MDWFRSHSRSVTSAGHFVHGIPSPPLRSLLLVFVGFLLVTGIARATSTASIPAIPIQIINTNAGRIMTAHADQYENKIYIGGLVYRPSSPGIGAHVHVWGVDKNNHTIFLKTTDVLITGKPSFQRTESYVVSVNPTVFDKAEKIFVTFHSQSDDESRKKDTP
jgi:hypothetical protein